MTNPPSATLPPAHWRKSSYSGGGNQCVEVAQIDKAVAVRDSKNPDGGHLAFAAATWKAFLGGAKAGNYDQ